MLVFKQGNFSRKNLSRMIVASVNDLTSALVKESYGIMYFLGPCVLDKVKKLRLSFKKSFAKPAKPEEILGAFGVCSP